MPYRENSFKDEKPPIKDRIEAAVKKVLTFIKNVLFGIGDWIAEHRDPLFGTIFACLALLGVLYGAHKIIGSSSTSCIEGGVLLSPGQVVNCSSSEEVIHTKQTPEGTFMYCACPGHDHSEGK